MQMLYCQSVKLLRPTQHYHIMKIAIPELHARLAATASAFEQLSSSLTNEQLYWRAQANSWSISEVMAHLYLTDSSYLRALDKKMAASPLGTGDGIVRTSPFGSVYYRYIKPGSWLKLPAPKIFRPKPDPISGKGIDFSTFHRHNQQLLERLLGYADKNLEQFTFPSPVTKLLRLNMGEALLILIAHHERHLVQAQKVKKAGGF